MCLIFLPSNRLPGSGRPSQITPDVKQIVEDQMRLDDETTAFQLYRLLERKGHPLSLRTILRCRTEFGWTFTYGQLIRNTNQLIRNANKIKHVEWTEQNTDCSFEDVVRPRSNYKLTEGFVVGKGESHRKTSLGMYIYVHTLILIIVGKHNFGHLAIRRYIAHKIA